MIVLFFGDVVGNGGCRALRDRLPGLKQQYRPDLVIVNGENSAQGNGILPASAQHLLDSGADVITTGNHVFRRREVYDLLAEPQGPIIRPANYSSQTPGRGIFLFDSLRCRAAVVNVMGVSGGLEPLRNPFDAMDEILATLEIPVVLVDFHAETTSEKRALGFYLDGRVSALVGTHTHVQTADEQLLPGGTAYITDVGMCGPLQSVLGVKPEQAITRFRTALPTRFENPDGVQQINGVALEIDAATGRAGSIERISLLTE